MKSKISPYDAVSFRVLLFKSGLSTSQLPVDRWYDIIGNPTIADAVLDRLIHDAYRIDLVGESLRKRRSATADSTRT